MPREGDDVSGVESRKGGATVCASGAVFCFRRESHLNLKMDDLGGAESSISPTEVADLPPGARTSRPFGRESGIFSKEKEKGASALIWPGRPSFGAMGGSAENSASYALGVAFKAIPSPELLARLEHQDFFWENLLVKAT